MAFSLERGVKRDEEESGGDADDDKHQDHGEAGFGELADNNQKCGHTPAVVTGDPQVADLVQLPGEHAADHDADAEPKTQQRNLQVRLQMQDVETPWLKVYF